MHSKSRICHQNHVGAWNQCKHNCCICFLLRLQQSNPKIQFRFSPTFLHYTFEYYHPQETCMHIDITAARSQYKLGKKHMSRRGILVLVCHQCILNVVFAVCKTAWQCLADMFQGLKNEFEYLDFTIILPDRMIISTQARMIKSTDMNRSCFIQIQAMEGNSEKLFPQRKVILQNTWASLFAWSMVLNNHTSRKWIYFICTCMHLNFTSTHIFPMLF